MDILDNPQVSLIQANELFHFTRYIYNIYIYTPNIPKYECSPPRRKAADMLPMKSATLPAATNLVPEGRYFETCTLEWVLICMFFFFGTDAARVRSSPKIDMLRPWVPEDIQIHFKSKICCHNQKCKSIIKSRCAHHRGCNKRILYPQLSNITRMLIIYLQICITMMSH